MKKMVTLVAMILVVLAGCSTEKNINVKPKDERIEEGKTTEAELEQILGRPSFYVTPEPPETGKYWIYISWRSSAGSATKYKTIRKVLVQDGIVAKYTSFTTVESE